MDVFETEAEVLALGGPVVRLFRTGLGRDPDPSDLAAYVSRLRQGAELTDLAQSIVEIPEFRNRHGPESVADDDFVRRLCAELFGAEARASERMARVAAASGASRAEVVAALAASAHGRDAIPVLPGVVPGAPPSDPLAYRLWVREYDTPTASALAAIAPLAGPRITVAMLAGDTTAEGALRSAESLRAQVYIDWELRIALARRVAPWPRQALEEAARQDARIVLLEAEPGTGRAASLNRALQNAGGAWGCILAPGDRLAPTALHEVVAEITAHSNALLIYTDEDRLDGTERCDPRFKPDATVDAMLTGDAIGQLALFERAFLDRLGGLRAEAAPHEAFDLARRAMLAAPKHLRHVPAVLCHRAELASDWPITASPMPPDADVPGLASIDPGNPWPRARFRPPHGPEPSVSVIVPTRDHAALLGACAAGVLDRTAYENLELVVVDNGSTAPDALETVARLERHPRVKIIRDARAFNFAALNNAAAAEARGDVLVLLNDDVEVTGPHWLAEMVAHATRPGVGAVGARLLYPSGTIQHAGMLLGPGGSAVHVGRGAAADDPGYLGQLACTRELSAVTAACLAVPSAAWRQVGGMDERLAVTWNDVDLCLRLRAAGLRVLWTPHATLTHHEGATRGLDAASAEHHARFEAERAIVMRTWGNAAWPDPFLNPNLLATEAGPLVLTRPRRRRPWHAASARAALAPAGKR